MKNLIFNIIIRILNIGFVKKSRLYAIASIYFKKTKELRSLKEKVNFLFYAFFHLRLYSAKTKASAIYKLAKGIRIHTDDDLFFYSIDTFAYLFNKGKVIDNCSLDYSEILSKSLNDFYITEHSKHKFVIENNKTVDAINLYLNRCINQIKQSSIKNKDNIISYLQEILTGEASCFASALQRILFFNQFMWQTGHNLVGLNRLDFILDKYIDKQMTDDDLFNYLKSFCTVLHKYYWFKSAALMGDTGQIIILGGKDANSNYFENRLTHIFIKVIKELNLPDPKILLRVSKETPENLWKEALDCVSTGVGSPLFSNDDVIIPALLQFGYQEKDATNYITSACWEPIPAECYEQNNLFDIFYIEPLNQLIKTESFENIKTFDELMNGYFDLLESQIKETEKKLDAINWEQDPLLSMFNTSCREALTDVAEGGAKYNNFGILSVSLANTVNSLLNIEELVFKKNKYTLSDVKQCCLNNFNDRDDILLTLKNKEKYFGRNEIEIQNFTNRILSKIN